MPSTLRSTLKQTYQDKNKIPPNSIHTPWYLLHVRVLDIGLRHKRLLDWLGRCPFQDVVRPTSLVVGACNGIGRFIIYFIGILPFSPYLTCVHLRTAVDPPQIPSTCHWYKSCLQPFWSNPKSAFGTPWNSIRKKQQTLDYYDSHPTRKANTYPGRTQLRWGRTLLNC